MKVLPMRPQPQPPLKFGRYRLVERLGEGGMAVAWRAVAEGPEGYAREVVVKRILPELSRNPQFTKVILAESILSGLLHHPAIIDVNDFGEVDGEYYLAMEFVDGYDLGRVLARCSDLKRPLPSGLACYVASEVAGALAYAHELTKDGRPLDIVHRDVSPSNVMLTKLGSVKLLDFGIAKASRLAPGFLDEKTRTGTLKGKIGYLSPEQVDGRPIDRRADIFALGIVLYECLTAERLFRASGDDLETLVRIRQAKVWPPSSVRPEIEPEVDAVVLKMLAREPEARFQTCHEVVAALAPIVHRQLADAPALKRFLDALGEIGKVEAGVVESTTPAKMGAGGRGGGGKTPEAKSHEDEHVHEDEQHVHEDEHEKEHAKGAGGGSRWRWMGSAAGVSAVALVVVLVLLGRGPHRVEVGVDGGAAVMVGGVAPPVTLPVAAPPVLHPRAGALRVAVVAFKNLGDDRELRFLSEGISDGIETELGRRHDRLVLVERTQIDQALKEVDFGQSKYADAKAAIALGRQTGAEVVILGSFQRAENRVRVTARFVDAERGEVLDTLSLDRPSSDYFGIQDAFAAAVGARLASMLPR